MIQRCRRGHLGRGPLSLTATAILLREDRNRDSPLQFEALQQRVGRTFQRALSSLYSARHANDGVLPCACRSLATLPAKLRLVEAKPPPETLTTLPSSF